MAGQDVDLSENIGSSLVGTCIALLVLSWVAVGLRTYTRAILMKSFQADDWLMLVAQVGCTSKRRIIFLELMRLPANIYRFVCDDFTRRHQWIGPT